MNITFLTFSNSSFNVSACWLYLLLSSYKLPSYFFWASSKLFFKSLSSSSRLFLSSCTAAVASRDSSNSVFNASSSYRRGSIIVWDLIYADNMLSISYFKFHLHVSEPNITINLCEGIILRAVPELIVWGGGGVGRHFLYDPTMH